MLVNLRRKSVCRYTRVLSRRRIGVACWATCLHTVKLAVQLLFDGRFRRLAILSLRPPLPQSRLHSRRPIPSPNVLHQYLFLPYVPQMGYRHPFRHHEISHSLSLLHRPHRLHRRHKDPIFHSTSPRFTTHQLIHDSS